MILLFTDFEEYIVKKVIETIEKETAFVDIREMPEPVLKLKNIKIHLRNETVSINDQAIELKHQEFLVLCHLAEHPGWIYSKDQIYDTVYSDEKIGDVENSIYCLIHGLRKKLETDPRHPQYIQTVRGAGYKFVIPEE